MADNVLASLFQDQANAIREGLGEIGKIKPADFPQRTREIVALIGSGSSGSSGGTVVSGSGVKIALGNFKASSNGIGQQTISHGLGEMPDAVFVYYGASTGTVMDMTDYPAISFMGFKSKWGSLGLGYLGRVGTTAFGYSNTTYGIDNMDTTGRNDGFIHCPDDSTFVFGVPESDGAVNLLDENGQYFWVAIAGMGSAVSDDVRYVTFRNESTGEEYVKAVATGDDCVDVVAKGLWATPAKESDAQYDYTFYGWGASDGGAADSTILQNITENKTVYAIFTATVRYYTITYYDDDGVTVLNTESLAYGSVPSYTPTKDGAVFDSWSPNLATVTGDASYTVVWSSVLASGTCGTSLTWGLTGDGVLTIAGTGSMTDYDVYTKAPWKDYLTSITEVKINDGVTSIGAYTFKQCTALTKVTIPESVTSIGDYAFWQCDALVDITIPNSVTSIGNYAFSGCTALPNITIPDSVATIGKEAFCECTSFTSVTIPDNVTSIGLCAFQKCSNLLEIKVGENNTAYCDDNGILFNKEMTRIIVAPIAGVIGGYTIPSTVESIERYAFWACTQLTSVIIPNSVAYIGSGAFGETGLTSATFENTSGWWYGTSETATSGTDLDSSSLANTSTAATYLKTTYCFKYWFRS